MRSSAHPDSPGSLDTDDTLVVVDNGAGRRVNNKIGFGILDSAAMVELAKSWENVAEQHECRIVRSSQDLSLK